MVLQAPSPVTAEEIQGFSEGPGHTLLCSGRCFTVWVHFFPLHEHSSNSFCSTHGPLPFLEMAPPRPLSRMANIGRACTSYMKVRKIKGKKRKAAILKKQFCSSHLQCFHIEKVEVSGSCRFISFAILKT